MNRMRGAIRTYAWGSRTAIADFTGRPTPAPHPEAELWLGAHPGDPATVTTADGEESLPELLRADPDGQLGAAVCDRFGELLPFLVKVLAADEPLSLQAHPSSAQAVEGFEREDRMGIPLSSSERNYRDSSHKPEILVALGPFEALAGFRPVEQTIALMRALAVADLDPYINLLAGQPEADGLRALFTTWITAPQPGLDVLVPAVLEGAISYVQSGRTEFAAEARTLLELGERYPGDAGVLAALLLNRMHLDPGQAIALPAGNLHSYLRGVGIEVMANSDNVLRGGLTPKHVDVPELMRVLDFHPVAEADLRPDVDHDGCMRIYRTPTPEFAVSVFDIEGEWLGHEIDAPCPYEGPQILVCTRGTVEVRGKAGTLDLDRGDAAWVPADDGPLRLRAAEPAQLFRATVGLGGEDEVRSGPARAGGTVGLGGEDEVRSGPAAL
ncbi:MAG TPA: mannose-6-phosphate isomerase, class I [Mycobacterium sp.]|nr:mannose-6-phosphate isomerase, class I [Mycobacterium sp.]